MEPPHPTRSSTKHTLTVSAPLSATGSGIDPEVERAVDEAAGETDSDSPTDFVLASDKAGSSLPDPPVQ